MKKMWLKLVATVLVISTLLTALPITTFAEGADTGEVYIESFIGLVLARVAI